MSYTQIDVSAIPGLADYCLVGAVRFFADFNGMQFTKWTGRAKIPKFLRKI